MDQTGMEPAEMLEDPWGAQVVCSHYEYQWLKRKQHIYVSNLHTCVIEMLNKIALNVSCRLDEKFGRNQQWNIGAGNERDVVVSELDQYTSQLWFDSPRGE